MQGKLRLIAATVLTLLTACASTTSKPLNPEQLALSKGYLLGNPVKDIRNYTLNGWNYVNDRAIIIDSSVNKRYLVTLRDRCHELSSRESIGTTATAGSMRAGLDAVLVRRDGAGRSLNSFDTHKCYIDKIYMISKIKKANQ
jgi:hypothetical protein